MKPDAIVFHPETHLWHSVKSINYQYQLSVSLNGNVVNSVISLKFLHFY